MSIRRRRRRKTGPSACLRELKERAAANPLAAAAIGAGLAWRFIHRPPIATLLIGAGLFGLLRTPAPQRSGEPYMGLRDEDPAWRRAGNGDLAQRATDMASAVTDKVKDWSAGAQDTARTAATQIADKAASVAESASQTLHDVGATARETFVQADGERDFVGGARFGQRAAGHARSRGPRQTSSRGGRARRRRRRGHRLSAAHARILSEEQQAALR